MKRRRWISLLFIPIALLGILWVATYFVNSTDAGSRWLVNRAINGVGGGLQIDRVQGSLESGLQLTGVRFESDDLTVELVSLRTVADLTLLPLRVEIESLYAAGSRTKWRWCAETVPTPGSASTIFSGASP